MGVALYEPTDQSGQPLNTVYAEDTRQLVRMLTAANDAGAARLSGQVASPASAPAITLQAGGVTGTGYQWCAYWITGTLDGTGAVHRNGVTLAGPLSTAQNLTSQEAVATAPASPPSQAIGWGLCRNKSGGGAYYVVAEAFLSVYGGAWPQITDNTPDGSLTTAAPAANTTGTSMGQPVLIGTDASKPPAAGLGRYYLATDTQRVYAEGASSWTQVGVVNWGDVAGKPASFTPSPHEATHLQGGSDALSGTLAVSITGNAATATTAASLGDTIEVAVATIMPPMAVPSSTSGPARALGAAWVGFTSGVTSGAPITGATASAYSYQAEVATVSSSAAYYVEFQLLVDGAGGTAYAELWDQTAGAAVSGSSVSTTTQLSSSQQPVLLRSGAVTLTAGHVYTAAVWQSNSSYGTALFGCRIVARI